MVLPSCWMVTGARGPVICLCVILTALTVWRTDSHAVGVITGPFGISGGTTPIQVESVVYSVELGLPAPGQELISIAIQINQAGPLPIRSIDIDRLRLYVDSNGNGAWDSGIDALIGEETAVGIGSMTTVADPSPSETIPAAGLWFFITVLFTGSASDRTFTVSAVTPPDNIRAQPPPPISVTADGGIPAGTFVTVWDPEDRVSPVPVGLEWIAGLTFLGYGVYWLIRRRVA